MNKYFIATIAMGLFLMSTPALGVIEKAEKKKAVTVTAQKQKKTEKSAKPAKVEKSKRVTLNFDSPKTKSKGKVKAKPKLKVVAKASKKKNYRSIYCQDGYVINNHAYCLISSAKTKPAKMVAKNKKSVKPVTKPVIKDSREVASKKETGATQRR